LLKGFAFGLNPNPKKFVVVWIQSNAHRWLVARTSYCSSQCLLWLHGWF